MQQLRNNAVLPTAPALTLTDTISHFLTSASSFSLIISFASCLTPTSNCVIFCGSSTVKSRPGKWKQREFERDCELRCCWLFTSHGLQKNADEKFYTAEWRASRGYLCQKKDWIEKHVSSHRARKFNSSDLLSRDFLFVAIISRQSSKH